MQLSCFGASRGLKVALCWRERQRVRVCILRRKQSIWDNIGREITATVRRKSKPD